MITFSSLIGKICVYIAQKVTDDKIKQSSDKRGHACELFTRLYFQIVELDSFTEYITESIDYSIEVKDTAVLGGLIQNIDRKLERCGNEFIQTFVLLSDVLEIYDPNLKTAIAPILACKFNLLWEVRDSLIVNDDYHDKNIVKIRYLDPRDEILILDIEKIIQFNLEHPERLDPKTCEWPQKLLRFGDLESAYTKKEVEIVSKEDLENFKALLVKHGTVLKEAKTKLKEFLKGSFTIDEVLYHQKSLETFWT